jgi:hypothetical protein
MVTHIALFFGGILVGANIGLLVFALLQAAGRTSAATRRLEAHQRWMRIHQV